MSIDATTKRMQVDDREFVIQALRLANGCFLTVSEGSERRIGSLVLALKTKDRVNTSTLIPGKYGGIFASMIAELVASRINGIAIVSLYLGAELSPPAMRRLLTEVGGVLASEASR